MGSLWDVMVQAANVAKPVASAVAPVVSAVPVVGPVIGTVANGTVAAAAAIDAADFVTKNHGEDVAKVAAAANDSVAKVAAVANDSVAKINASVHNFYFGAVPKVGRVVGTVASGTATAAAAIVTADFVTKNHGEDVAKVAAAANDSVAKIHASIHNFYFGAVPVVGRMVGTVANGTATAAAAIVTADFLTKNHGEDVAKVAAAANDSVAKVAAAANDSVAKVHA